MPAPPAGGERLAQIEVPKLFYGGSQVAMSGCRNAPAFQAGPQGVEMPARLATIDPLKRREQSLLRDAQRGDRIVVVLRRLERLEIERI